MTDRFRVSSWPSLGTTASLALVVEPHLDDAVVDEAVAMLRNDLEALDLACSRFRPDSELTRLNQAPPGSSVDVSDLLLEAVEAALGAARATGGLVDPTVGTALEMIGYDRDFACVEADGPALTFVARPVPGWHRVEVDRVRGAIRLGPGARLDLGATAKAWCADRAAGRIAARFGIPALVSLGGDIAAAGPSPDGGWPIRIGPDHRDPVDGPGPAVSINSGGLATSSTTARRWRRGGQDVHHLIDPRTSCSALSPWTLASVAAASCLDANVASCAAILMGADAPAWLQRSGLPARLVKGDGDVVLVGGWPSDERGAVRDEVLC